MPSENAAYFVEDAGAADLISDGRLQLGLSRGAPEQVVDGWRHFGFRPAEGESDADMARRHTMDTLRLLEGTGFAEPIQLIEELARDEVIAEADTLLITAPNFRGQYS